jgi:hypothetical protein
MEETSNSISICIGLSMIYIPSCIYLTRFGWLMKRGDRKKIFIMDRFSLWWHRKYEVERQLLESFLTNPIRQERMGRQIFFMGVFGLVLSQHG